MIKKWLLRRAPGSPGHTARYWVRTYLKSRYDDKTERLLELILSFQYVQSEIDNLRYSEDPTKYMDRCDGCVASLMFALLCDTNGYVMCTTDVNDNAIVNIVYEEVSKLAPDDVLTDLETYRLRCFKYEHLSKLRENC